MPLGKQTQDNILTLGAIIALIMAIVAGVFAYIQQSPVELAETEYRRADTSLEDIQNDFKLISTRIENIENQVRDITAISKEAPEAPRIAAIESDLRALEERLNLVTTRVLGTYQKPQNIPITKDDFDSLKKGYKETVELLRQEVSHSQHGMRWAIGAMALGLLALSLSVYIFIRRAK